MISWILSTQGCHMLYQGVRWRNIIEGAILSDDDITHDVILMDFGKILGALKPPSPPANALLGLKCAFEC